MSSNAKIWKYYSLIVISLLIAVLLGCFVFTSPAQMKAEAASAKQYIAELKMSYGDTEADARKALIDNSYTPIKQDFNKGNKRYVWLGYKTTTNPSEAITDVAMMGEKQGYSYTEYEEMLKREYERYEVLADSEMVLIKEFRTRYHAGSPFAILVYNDLNNFKEDDSGMLVGDFFLDENLSKETLTKFVTQISQYTLASFNEVLSIAVAENDVDNVFERLAALTQAQIEDAKKNLGYYDSASMLYTAALDLKKTFNDYENVKDKLEDDAFVKENEATAAYLLQFAFLYDYFKVAKVGTQTLFDIFMKQQIDMTDMYPFVSVMTSAQIEAVGLAGFYPLFNATNAVTKAEVEEFVGEIDAKDKVKPEVISAYYGVDRKMFQGGVAVTDEAMRKMQTTGDTSAMWGNISSAAEIGMMVGIGVASVTAIASVGYIIGKGISTAKKLFGSKWIGNVNKGFSMKPSSLISNVKWANSTLKGNVSMNLGGVSDVVVPVSKTSAAKFPLNKLKFAVAGIAFYVAIAVITIIFTVFTILEVVNYYNPTYTETPKILLDRNEDKSAYTRYDAVMTYNTIDNREEIGDVNAYKGKKWGALYTTKDPTAGKPLLADAQVFTNKTAMTKKEYKAVHKFGITTPAAFNEYNFSVKDEIYLYFKQDLSTTFSASVFAEKATPFLIAILGLIVGFGSAALIFNRKKKVKNQVEEKQDDDKSNDGKSNDDKSNDEKTGDEKTEDSTSEKGADDTKTNELSLLTESELTKADKSNT